MTKHRVRVNIFIYIYPPISCNKSCRTSFLQVVKVPSAGELRRKTSSEAMKLDRSRWLSDSVGIEILFQRLYDENSWRRESESGTPPGPLLQQLRLQPGGLALGPPAPDHISCCGGRRHVLNAPGTSTRYSFNCFLGLFSRFPSTGSDSSDGARMKVAADVFGFSCFCLVDFLGFGSPSGRCREEHQSSGVDRHRPAGTEGTEAWTPLQSKIIYDIIALCIYTYIHIYE